MADDLNLLPCPFCGGKPVLSKTPNMHIVECNNEACGSNPDALAVLKHDVGVAWNNRAAPIAAQLDAELPPHYGLFNVNGPDGHRIKGWTAEQVQSIVAPYAERIRLLEREKAERAHGLVGSIGDYTGFCSLLDGYGQALVECSTAGYYRETIVRKDAALAALIAYIDGRTAGAAWISVKDQLPPNEQLPDGRWNSVLAAWKEGELDRSLHQIDVTNSAYLNANPEKFTHWMPVPAAPSPQSPLDEVKNG